MIESSQGLSLGGFVTSSKKEVMLMKYITISDLFTYSLVLIAFASLIIEIIGKNGRRK